jgi:hypothetical protein
VTNAVSAGSFAITLRAAGDLHHVRCGHTGHRDEL